MALPIATVSFDLHQMLGEDFDPRRAKVYVKTNIENETLIDTATGETRLGEQSVDIGDDGTGSFDTWTPDAAGNPTSWQTSIVVDYPCLGRRDRLGRKDRASRTFGPYTITRNVKSITGKARTSNVATMTTSTAHDLMVGDDISVVSVGGSFDGIYTVTAVPTTTTFSYANTAGDVSATTATGAFSSPNVRLALLEEEQGVPAEYLTTVTELLDTYVTEAEAARDAAVDISGISTSDGVVEALVKNTGGAGPLTSAALSASYVRPHTTPTTDAAAPVLTVNVRDFGAKSDAESFMYDSGPAIQAAIDYCSAEGGGDVVLPNYTPDDLDTSSGDFYKIRTIRTGQTIYVRYGVTLRGQGAWFLGTRLVGMMNGDVIRFEEVAPGSGYIAPCGVRDLHIRGKFGSTSGCGISTKNAAGNGLSLEHGVTLSHITLEDHAEDGLLILGGSGVNDVDNIFGYMNGGYGVHLKGSTVQMVGLTNIYGDGNVSGAALCIEDTDAGYAVNITNLKSEQIVQYSGRGHATIPSQPNALHLKNCAGRVNINGLQHISSINNTYKPGDAIVVTGANRPRSLQSSGHEIRYPWTSQTTGSDPVLLRDTVGATVTFPQDTATLVYPGNVDYSKATAVTVPTASGGDDSQKAASTAFVKAGYQPLDSDLTAIAALSTTSYGRALLIAADAAAVSVTAGLASKYGDQITTGQETVSRDIAISTVSMSTGNMRLGYFTARKSETVATIRTVSATGAGATPTLCKVGLYTVAGNGDLTLVATSANTTSLWSASSTGYNTALSTPYAVTAGTRYAVAALSVTAASAATVAGGQMGPAADVGTAPRLCGFVSGQTDLPSSVSAASVSDSSARLYAVLVP